MNNEMRDKLKELHEELVRLDYEKEIVKLKIAYIKRTCPHTNKIRWTNNDGDGQFIVERCPDCGLQKDGGL